MFFYSEPIDEMAESEWMTEISEDYSRGLILDCKGEVLAQSGSSTSVKVLPNDKGLESAADKEYVATNLARILDLDKEDVYKKVSNTDKYEIWIKRHITDVQKNEIVNAGLEQKGVVMFSDVRRYYPYSGYLSQVLGYLDADGNGQAGIEKLYNDYLNGKNGSALAFTDKRSNTISGTEKTYLETQNGCNIILTVDQVIQDFAENATAKAYEESGAASVITIVMDSETSDIKAVVNYPEMDLNNIRRDDIDILNELSENKAFEAEIEPGSLFDLITLSAALNCGAASASTSYQCDGSITINDEKVFCNSSGNSHGNESVSDAITDSCDLTLIDMTLNMGKDVYYNYIYDYGFGSCLGVSGVYEASGNVRNQKYINENELAAMSCGKSFSVTPIQIANAYCSLINGGKVNTPHIIESITDYLGYMAFDVGEGESVDIISEETSAIVTDIMKNYVESGIGSNASVSGYTIGGISGSSFAVNDNGETDYSKEISSFIGFNYGNDEQYLVMMMIVEPTCSIKSGNSIAAPYVKEILENCLKYGNVKRDTEETEEYILTPNIVGLDYNEAKEKLNENGLRFECEGSGNVAIQSPSAGTQVRKGSTVSAVVINGGDTDYTEAGVPNLYGLTLTEAYETLREIGLKLSIENECRGNATITEQSPAFGEKYSEGDTVKVKTESIINETGETENENQ